MTLLRTLAACLIAALPAVAQPPQNGRNVALGHIHLTSANPDAAVAFWTEIIGAGVYSRESLRGVSMIGGTIPSPRRAAVCR